MASSAFASDNRSAKYCLNSIPTIPVLGFDSQAARKRLPRPALEASKHRL